MWVKLDDSFSTHPKVTGLRVAIRWTYIAALCHAGRHLTDGVIDKGFLHTVPKGHADALVTAGLWDTDDAGVRIHDYLEYNPTREKVLAERTAARRRKERRTDGVSSPDVRPTEHREDGRTNAGGSASPSLSLTQDPVSTASKGPSNGAGTRAARGLMAEAGDAVRFDPAGGAA